jgi:hypothetical protein
MGLDRFPEPPVRDAEGYIRWMTTRTLPDLTTAALDPLRTTLTEFAPDLILRDRAERAALLLSIKTGIPEASVASSAEHALLSSTNGDHWLTAVAQFHGIDKTDLTHALRHPLFNLCLHPAMFHAAHRIPGNSVFAQHTGLSRSHSPAAQEILDLTDRSLPLVVIGVGSIADNLFPELLPGMLRSVSELPVTVVVFKASFGARSVSQISDNAILAVNGPQAEILQEASVVLCHGGFATVLDALCTATPVVAVPLISDWFYTAEQCARMGAGITIDFSGNWRQSITEAVDSILGTDTFHTAAKTFAAANSQLPSAQEVLSSRIPF